MKVIKIGIPPQQQDIEKTCYKCNTVFSYNNADIKSDSRDGDYVECPICKSFIKAER